MSDNSQTIYEEALENCQQIPDTQVEAQHADMVVLLMKDPEEILKTLTAMKVSLIHASMGACGEAGELLDAVKKHIAYNRPIDLVNVIEEMGDLEFYLENLRTSLHLSRKLILEFNRIKLLKKRYPNGYSDEAAQRRMDKVTTFGYLYGTPQLGIPVKQPEETKIDGLPPGTTIIDETCDLIPTQVFDPTDHAWPEPSSCPAEEASRPKPSPYLVGTYTTRPDLRGRQLTIGKDCPLNCSDECCPPVQTPGLFAKNGPPAEPTKMKPILASINEYEKRLLDECGDSFDRY